MMIVHDNVNLDFKRILDIPAQSGNRQTVQMNPGLNIQVNIAAPFTIIRTRPEQKYLRIRDRTPDGIDNHISLFLTDTHFLIIAKLK